MGNFSASVRSLCKTSAHSVSGNKTNPFHKKISRGRWLFLAGALFASSLVVAQSTPQVTGVDPASGKVNDTVTVSGSNLGKASVSSIYLSDDKNDYKATIVDQSDDKISMKVPQVKAGEYNVSIQVGDKLFIKPVRFTVEE
jgi:hypothetical protein